MADETMAQPITWAEAAEMARRAANALARIAGVDGGGWVNLRSVVGYYWRDPVTGEERVLAPEDVRVIVPDDGNADG